MSKLWGGRFSEDAMDERVLAFTSSVDIDGILAKYDCLASKVHVETLYRAKILSSEERQDLLNVLDKLLEKIANDSFSSEGYEDIHSAVHGFVKEKLPETGGKLHTGRSRNEQIVNDVRLYIKDVVRALEKSIKKVQSALVRSAGKDPGSVLPGYTHLNRAQPVVWGHLLLSYVEMLERDISRLAGVFDRTDMSVMGSGALAGNGLGFDRDFTAKKLGFSKISQNSMDAVSDRDFICELLFAIAMTGVHLSRISEDMILYSSSEFGFVEMDGRYCTGSSLMPQKKNADVLELIRGRSSVLISSLNGVMILLKGLPHCYNRDLQDDKRFLSDSVKLITDMLDMLAMVSSSLKINKENALKALENEFIYATDIAEYLVKKGVAFEKAHHSVGQMVKYCSSENIKITDLSPARLKSFNEEFEEDVLDLLDPQVSVKSKNTEGSSNPRKVKERLSFWKKKSGGK